MGAGDVIYPGYRALMGINGISRNIHSGFVAAAVQGRDSASLAARASDDFTSRDFTVKRIGFANCDFGFDDRRMPVDMALRRTDGGCERRDGQWRTGLWSHQYRHTRGLKQMALMTTIQERLARDGAMLEGAPVSSTQAAVDLSVVIPAYNEAKGIALTIAEVQAALSQLDLSFEIIVIDDGSKDGTADAAAQAGARVISNPKNLG